MYVYSKESSVAASANHTAADRGHCDTVGAVAVDACGNFAYATSTGGITAKEPGRVGDSPTPGDCQTVRPSEFSDQSITSAKDVM